MRIPLELDDVDLDLFKWTTFLDCASLGEDPNIAPPYSTMGEPLLGTSSHEDYLNGWQASSLGFLRDAPLELALLNIDDDHHLTSSIMGHMKSSFDANPWKDT